MVGHDNPGIQLIPFSVEMKECVLGQASNSWPVQPTFPVSSVQVIFEVGLRKALSFDSQQGLPFRPATCWKAGV